VLASLLFNVTENRNITSVIKRWHGKLEDKPMARERDRQRDRERKIDRDKWNPTNGIPPAVSVDLHSCH